MLTAAEKRFLRYWEEQRRGGKWAYYALYILAGTFITAVIVNFLKAILSIGLLDKIWVTIIISFIIALIITAGAWITNEKKFKRIIQREIREGQSADDKYSDEN